ncbi:MAG: hypothetical protein NTX22_12745 [Ignavibacteriales bacterium]|nr:hypothetical protein [Ignavibacteriales bacterium]
MTNIVVIERAREALIQSLSHPGSCLKKLLLINNFFEVVLSSNDPLITQSYILEFIDLYKETLKKYSPLYLDPQITQNVLEQINKVSALDFLSDYRNDLTSAHSIIQQQLNELYDILIGKDKNPITNKLLFPVLEVQNNNGANFTLGILDSITIEITRASKDQFIIIPSEIEIEERLQKQIENSWQSATNYVKRLIRKIGKYHKVIIQFDERVGYYIGESLGVTLAIGFIEKLLKYYNSPYLVNIKSSIASTGGLESSGKITRTGDEIIKKKVEVVFFSSINSFVVPNDDLLSAEQKINELNEVYPERKLKLVPAKDLDDLLDRRSLIEIKKQNPVVRTAKNVKRHWGVSVLLLLLILLSSYYAIRDYDDNPAILESVGQTVYVKNKSGKVLWNLNINFDSKNNYQTYLKYFVRLIDINGDGVNELFATHEIVQFLKNKGEKGRLVCFDKYGNEIWKYIFKDTVFSQREFLPPPYFIRLLDTITVNKQKQLVAIAINDFSYSAALFKLDLITGKRLDGTLWNSGHIREGFIYDIDDDSSKEIIFAPQNNGYAKTSLAIIDIKELSGTKVLPTTPEYLIKNYPLAKTLMHILYPNSDYNKFLNLRWASMEQDHLRNHPDIKCIFQAISQRPGSADILFLVGYNLKDIEIKIENSFRIQRDTLVVHGKLKPPLTDTPEYCNIIKSQILYWNGKKFVKREEMK